MLALILAILANARHVHHPSIQAIIDTFCCASRKTVYLQSTGKQAIDGCSEAK